MREAAIIIPTQDRNGHSGSERIRAATAAIVDTFGGCTLTPGSGWWRNPRTGVLDVEPVSVLTFAIGTEVSEYQTKIDVIAARLARSMDQEAIYIRYPGGEVVILDRAEYLAIFESALLEEMDKNLGGRAA